MAISEGIETCNSDRMLNALRLAQLCSSNCGIVLLVLEFGLYSALKSQQQKKTPQSRLRAHRTPFHKCNVMRTSASSSGRCSVLP
eukprot:scaffold243081_cov20-Prasinocladus_malaysianus.AAC.1